MEKKKKKTKKQAISALLCTFPSYHRCYVFLSFQVCSSTLKIHQRNPGMSTCDGSKLLLGTQGTHQEFQPVMVQSCYSEHRAPTIHPYSTVFWSRRIQCEWSLPEVVQWAEIIFANLRCFRYNHCPSSTSWAVCGASVR